jgi:hypothetical protein
MRTFSKTLLVLPALTDLTLLAGALRLEVENPEAKAQRAALVARITACQAPEKTNVTATAEGVVDGNRCIRNGPVSGPAFGVRHFCHCA